MGKRKRLNGYSTSPEVNGSKDCPNCGRKFREYRLVRDGGRVRKVCPYCGHQFS